MSALFAFIFGTLIGSFLNVVIWRLPRARFLTGRSHCPGCGHSLAPLELVPIVSYLGLRGRCKNCKSTISPRYMIIESITGALFALLFVYLHPSSVLDYASLVRMFFICSVLIAVFVIDLEHYLILDKIIVPSGLVLLMLNVGLDIASGRPLFAYHSLFFGGLVTGFLIGGFLFLLWFFSKGTWMGFGDVKFGVWLGLALSWPLAFVCLFLSFMLGTFVSVPLLLLRRKQLTSRLPFGTFLSAAAIITMLAGEPLALWYARLIGWR